MFSCADFTRAIALAKEAVPVFRARNERWHWAATLDHQVSASFYAGRFEEGEPSLNELEQLAREVGALGALGYVQQTRGLLALARSGDLSQWAQATDRITEAYARTGGVWRHAGALFKAHGLILEGRWQQAAEVARTVGAAWDETQWRGARAGVEIVACAYFDPASARATFDAHRHQLPAPGAPAHVGPRYLAIMAVEALAVIGALDEAAELYPHVCGAIAAGFLVLASELSENAAGIAAAAAGEWDRSEAHFATALSQAHSLPHRVAQPDVRRWHAWMLRRRKAPGDRERAAVLLAEALGMYREIGMAGHVALVEAELGSG
jgi:tetratricopeptide (TPR) repeat protein